MNELFNVKDKVVVITGGAGILGKGIAAYLAKEGAKVVVLDRSEEAGKALVDSIKAEGNEAMFLYTDVMDKEVLEGNKVEGKYKPSSDTATHLELYKKYPEIGGIVHTHSPEAVAWAQAGRDIPLYGTTHADYFFGAIPCARNLTQEEIDAGYEKNTGTVIIETFEERGMNPMYTPAVLCKNHGPFTWGKDAAEAVHNAVVLEEVAKMARNTEALNPNVKPAPDSIKEKHFYRKHGANAYYGQN